MTSEVTICNLALARLGDDATVTSISPPEGSVQADHCARFYPLARDCLLQMHPWSFAVQEQSLAQLLDEYPGWTYCYAQPAETLAVSAVLPVHKVQPNVRTAFVTQTGTGGQSVILTNEPNARVRCIVRVTDTKKYSPTFVDALAWLLASYLAGVIIKGSEGATHARVCLQGFNTTVAQARVADANQSHTPVEHRPVWIQAR